MKLKKKHIGKEVEIYRKTCEDDTYHVGMVGNIVGIDYEVGCFVVRFHDNELLIYANELREYIKLGGTD